MAKVTGGHDLCTGCVWLQSRAPRQGHAVGERVATGAKSSATTPWLVGDGKESHGERGGDE